MKVLAVEHTGGIESFRGKWEWLSRYPDVDLTLLAPETWIENYRLIRASTAPAGGAPYRIRTGRVAWRGYENRGFFFTGLLAAIRAARPDILHLVEEPFSLFALQSARLCRAFFPDVRILFYTSDNLHRGFRYSYRPAWAYARIERIVQRLADCGVASCTDAGLVMKSRGFTKPLRYVPLSLDPERFHPRETRAEREQLGLKGFVIGYAGRLLAMKGLAVLAGALERIPGEWTCLILGNGPERAAFEEAARRGGWHDRLRIIEMVPHDRVPAILNLMDALVLPSLTMPRAREQFGRVLIEAMACGVPVVGSDSGSIPEVIGEAGLVVPEGQPGELAAALGALRDDEALRRRLVEAGFERVRRHFTWQKAAEQYKAIYDGLLAGNLAGEEQPAWAARSAEPGSAGGEQLAATR